MKRILGMAFAAVALCSASWAQDLDTTTVTDQLNLGAGRGNNLGTGPSFNNSLQNGTEFAAYSGADSTGGPINYINAYAGATASETESPIATVTSAMTMPDRGLVGSIPAIPANTRPGATGASTALLVSDDGGQNGIGFGQADDANYYIQADVYCWDHPGLSTEYEMAHVAARAYRDEASTSGAYNVDRDGSYCMGYDYQTSTVYAMQWLSGNTTGQIQVHPPDVAAAQIFATVNNVTGWHTFKVSCLNTTIKFYLDGAEIASVTDSDVAIGRPALGYRENGVASASERTGIFDNVIAGPTVLPPAAVADWQIFE